MAKRADRIGRKRPWRILSAPLPRDWDLVLAEVESDLGLELYDLVRKVRLVGDCSHERRPRLFRGKGSRHVAERRTEAIHEAPQALRRELRVLMRISGRQPPEDAEAAHACEAIADWAQEEGYPDTACHFAEAAAQIDSSDPYFAFIAGRTNRLVGVPWRAEVFYTRAIRHAYRYQNWDVYVRANLGLGRLHADRGRIRTAARHYFSAARVALDQGQDWLAAQTYHDVFPLHYEIGNIDKAHELAHKALATYPQHHERFPVAVHDYLLLLILERHFAEAWPILQRLVQAPLRSHDQVLVWGTIARTAGSLGLTEGFADAEARVLELAPHWDAFAPAAYLGLATGAHGLRDRALAASYANKGLILAEAKQDRQARLHLQNLIADLDAARPAPPPIAMAGELAEELQALRGVIEVELASWRSDRTWTAKESQRGLWTLGPV